MAVTNTIVDYETINKKYDFFLLDIDHDVESQHVFSDVYNAIDYARSEVSHSETWLFGGYWGDSGYQWNSTARQIPVYGP